MPNISFGYIYTLFAMMTLSGLLIFSFMAYAETIKWTSETKRLEKLLDYVTAKGTDLITLVSTTNATSEAFLQMPTLIGDKHYWLQLGNDSTEAWIAGGFGDTPTQSSLMRIYLPKKTFASGHYGGVQGALHLRCSLNGSVPHISIAGRSEE